MAGRAVPRLHDGRVVLVEGPLVLAHVVARAEGLGHHHHEGMLHGPSARHEELQDVVEDPRVAESRGDHGRKLPDIVPEEGG